MLQQNSGIKKQVRIEAIRPFYKAERASDGTLSRAVIGVGDVVEVPPDVAADLISCGKAAETEAAIRSAKPAKGGSAEK